LVGKLKVVEALKERGYVEKSATSTGSEEFERAAERPPSSAS
jgi:hypothetical protein